MWRRIWTCQNCTSYGYCNKLQGEEIYNCPFYSHSIGSEKCEFCPIGKFTNAHYTECLDCPEHCLDCSGGRALGECNQCEKGYGKKKDYKGCFLCKENEYSDGFGECI